MIISFFGHSSFNKTEAHEQKLLSFLEEKVGDFPADFYLGGYGAFDDFAFKCCQKYKNEHPSVSLIFITPYITVEYQQNHLKDQKEKYDFIIYPEIEQKPLKFAIFYRNRWMVDKADFIICCIDHSWGGAFKAYQYAKQKKKSIFNISEKDIDKTKE